MDAWLANWDVVGQSFDNILIDAAGKAVRIDAGGALKYRAQGGLKGYAFGDEVGELKSLRDRYTSVQGNAVFGGMSNHQIKASAKKLLEVPDSTIEDIVRQFGPGTLSERGALARRLIARRNSIAKQVAPF